MQMGIMACSVPQDTNQHSLASVLECSRAFSDAQRCLISQVCTLASLILVMPATNAMSEQSFSALRRLKSYLQTTMTQTQLNSILVLHIHQECTDSLDLKEVGNEFVTGSEHRQTVFGKF